VNYCNKKQKLNLTKLNVQQSSVPHDTSEIIIISDLLLRNIFY